MKKYFDDRAGLRFASTGFASTAALSAVLLLSSGVMAQEGGDNPLSSDGLAPATGGEAAATSDSASAPASPPPSETAPSGDAASTEAQLSASGATTPPDGSVGAKASETSASVANAPVALADKPAPPPLALEILPSSAYPSDPVPGLRGGSLEFVRSGQQWPYMPSYGDGQPRLRIGFSGSSWVDFNYKAARPGLATYPDIAETRVQGRLTLRVSPVYNFKDGWFGQSRIEFVGITEQQNEPNKYVDLDEAWVRFGKWNKFDLTVGRTQGFEVYHFGMGLDINTQEREGAQATTGTPVQQAYSVSELWDRGINNGAAAVHIYMPKWLRLELLGRMGATSTGNDLGFRPAAIVDLGWLKLKGGYEVRVESPTEQSGDLTKREMKGYGGQVNFVLGPWVEFGGGAAHRVVDRWKDDGAVDVFGSSDTTTFGGFVNVRPYFKDWLVGLGYHNTNWNNYNIDSFGYPEDQIHQQVYGAVQYQLWDHFYFKYVLAYSSAQIEQRNDDNPADTGYENRQFSNRFRFMMTF